MHNNFVNFCKQEIKVIQKCKYLQSVDYQAMGYIFFMKRYLISIFISPYNI